MVLVLFIVLKFRILSLNILFKVSLVQKHHKIGTNICCMDNNIDFNQYNTKRMRTNSKRIEHNSYKAYPQSKKETHTSQLLKSESSRVLFSLYFYDFINQLV